MSREINIDCRGENCPVPLVNTRKAVRKADKGDTILVKGDHAPSKKEIPMAAESMDLEVISIEENDEYWEIKIKV